MFTSLLSGPAGKVAAFGRFVWAPYDFTFISMAVGTGGGGGAIVPPPLFCQPIKFKSLEITTYKLMYMNKAK